MTDFILLILVNFIVWTYTIVCLVGGKGIQFECKNSSKIVTVILFVILAFLIFIRIFNIYGLLNIASFLLAAAILSIIPSGFSEEAVIISGRLYPFKKIKDLDYETKDGKIIISFKYHNRPLILFADIQDKEMIKAYVNLYRKRR